MQVLACFIPPLLILGLYRLYLFYWYRPDEFDKLACRVIAHAIAVRHYNEKLKEVREWQKIQI